ncbi:Hypothetical predicted protein [Mytilus galloprovincialis]|uniref:Ig-like domain-containing protein n=1 Tax=Mytilus galloprovincialis TaxID=29158 RepID=A0A8B6BLB6_MYTGA|nr:Hypothetical predicted protein [Mytilus galloprovincialis]
MTPAGINNVVNVTVGDTYIFSCVTGSSRPAAWIQWYIGRENITDQTQPQTPQPDGDKFTSSSRLVYTGKDEDHNKNIYCAAINIEERDKVKSTEILTYIQNASEYAGAGFTVGDNHIVHFMWDKEDRIKSSTWRELKAVKNILESLQLMLCRKLVKLYTDNKNVVNIVQKGTSGVDAFAYDWSKFNNLVVPPVSLITRAVNHMQMCKAKGVLVVPKWKSAICWPRI